MEKYVEYIRQVEIAELWHGRKHIVWHLDPKVNVLSGANGVGKSTILRRLASGVSMLDGSLKMADCHDPEAEEIQGGREREVITGISISTYPDDATLLRYDIITTPDVRSEFDTNLQELQRRVVHYPHNERWQQFCDIVDDMFAPTEKTIVRDADVVTLMQWGEELSLKLLSSGEKQMLTILITVLLEDGDHTVLLMDEPEVSLHMEWQQVLISTILSLNPNVQIILTTHSPAIIMNGWMDKVTEVSDITV